MDNPVPFLPYLFQTRCRRKLAPGAAVVLGGQQNTVKK